MFGRTIDLGGDLGGDLAPALRGDDLVVAMLNRHISPVAAQSLANLRRKR